MSCSIRTTVGPKPAKHELGQYLHQWALNKVMPAQNHPALSAFLYPHHSDQ